MGELEICVLDVIPVASNVLPVQVARHAVLGVPDGQ